ncbi:MAG: toll/interleukin-1 receptor domain-containing protein [Clostridia bacterium]|nr:toll/interleukin-1 receptor domain-containing protein [Clostridia bacterium]
MAYDVFISYKCSDDNGERTRDYAIAKEIEESLLSLGYSVFFSSDTLEQLGSSRYKADIDQALDSAKLMVVVLTKAEYALSHWVQYEWDSFYNDYLSGLRKDANLFTVTLGVDIHDLPRTLRNVQNFPYESGTAAFVDYVKHVLKKEPEHSPARDTEPGKPGSTLTVITGRQITEEDIAQAVQLDALVYEDEFRVNAEQCFEWFKVNPDIYVMAKEASTGRVIAYVNISPVTDECYERIKRGDFIDTGITADMILSYDMPFPYSVYFSSIVIHPEYQNTEVFMQLFNSVIKKFIYLGEHEVYVKRMVADAVTANGEKFCKLFGMKKVKGSDHNSTLYEISMIPPKFRVLSKMLKKLYDYYQIKYLEAPYLFD